MTWRWHMLLSSPEGPFDQISFKNCMILYVFISNKNIYPYNVYIQRYPVSNEGILEFGEHVIHKQCFVLMKCQTLPTMTISGERFFCGSQAPQPNLNIKYAIKMPVK